MMHFISIKTIAESWGRKMDNRMSQRISASLVLIAMVTFLSACATTGANYHDAVELRNQGVAYAASGNYVQAKPLLERAAKLGVYTAQMEYAVLLDTSPPPVHNDIEAFAWYAVVIARDGADTEFAKERKSIVVTRLDPEGLQQGEKRAKALFELYISPQSK